MTITDNFLVGAAEPFDETIRALISRDWNAANTETVTPKFLSPHGRDSDAADFTSTISTNAWMKDINKDLMRFKMTDTIRFAQAQPTGNKFFMMLSTIAIDIFAERPNRYFLFDREINRIIQETIPNNAVRIKKSNNTDDSAIHTFDRQVIEFTKIGDFAEGGIRYQWAGELGIVWQRIKT